MNEQHATADAFSLLHPRVQHELYRMGWTELRDIQVESIKVVRTSNRHLLISANTAAGKTEAAFLPILSDYLDNPPSGIHTLYVSPLKALINDQFRRLDQLCEQSEIPVHRWHGDVQAAAKRRIGKTPSGVLLITPESVESLFINHTGALPKMFGQLRFVVIDELHGFLGTERGTHLRSLLARIRLISKSGFRFVGLSATIGNADIAKRWMFPDMPHKVQAVHAAKNDKEIRYQVKVFLTSITSEAEVSAARAPGLADALVKDFAGKTVLVFTNSRRNAEILTDSTKRLVKESGLRAQFEIHHGSLSRDTREFTEDALRSDKPTVAFCTSTLEMGIDLGNIKEIGQIGTPHSVSSLVQRLGRSGRKDEEPSVMRVYLVEDKETKDELVPRLRPQLIQAIAMTELMLQKWCEPPSHSQLHFDALIQQTLSIIRERGGATAQHLYQVLVTDGAFNRIDANVYARVLRSMARAGYLEQTDAGLLILGERGEKLVGSLAFYAVFETPEELKVLHGGTMIGSIYMNIDIQSGSHIILGGRRWEVVEVELESKHLYVRPSPAGAPPMFEPSEFGDTHPRVHEAMREVLCGLDVPVYLDSTGKDLLRSARNTAAQIRLAETNIIETRNEVMLFTWAGSRVNRTLNLLIGEYAGLSCSDKGICICVRRARSSQLRDALQDIAESNITDEQLCESIPPIKSGKYVPILDEDLRTLNAFHRHFDLDGALFYLRVHGLAET